MKRIALRRQTINIGVITFLLVALFRVIGGFEFLELKAVDVAFNLRGASPPTSPIVIVAIDDESFNQTNLHWPWPRWYFAQIIDKLKAGGARAVVIDVIFYEPFDGDAVLAESIQNSKNVILANNIGVVSDPNFRLEQVNMPVDALVKTDAPIGLSNFPSDRDGFGRHILAFQSLNEKLFYHWAVIATAKYLNQNLLERPTSTSIPLTNRAIPLRDQTLLLNYRGPPRTFRNIPAYQVVNGDVPAEFFKDKIVLIGSTTETLHDNYPTPFGGSDRKMPGVEIGANAIDMMLTQNYLTDLDLVGGLAWMMIAGLVGIALNLIRRPALALLGLGLSIFIFAMVWLAAFVLQHIELPFVSIQATLFLTFIVPTVERAIVEESAKRRVRAIFAQFIAPEMVEQLVEQGIESSRGKRAELTILFSDIRGFTTLAEKLAPDQLVAILNQYLAAMTDVIFKHGGTVDKFEGDAIIAFWGAPQADARHASRALAAALAMRKELTLLKQKWNSANAQGFEIGIGLNSGEAFVGLIGSEKRINYTVIGDNVNLASRIQDLTKEYRWPLLISESTFAQVKNEFDAEFLEAKLVKGKTVPVGIYRVLGTRGAPEDERVRPVFA
ncbi:MAG: adenylate/guanylate cyclase domain-containing protein [Chloroflexi bacterium]|nr:adenylate/guanylate cyclase domain-containing protein [Chloroflexota bacterium]